MTLNNLQGRLFCKPRLSAISLSVSLFILSACQTIANDTSSTTSNKSTPIQAVSNNSLAPRNLSPGECGLFVWAGEARDFIVFTQNGQSAVLAKDGQEVSLTPSPATISGDLYGQISVQNFTDASGITYGLALSAEEDIDGGIRYSSGTWRYTDSQGWDVLKPVYGLSTCQALD